MAQRLLDLAAAARRASCEEGEPSFPSPSIESITPPPIPGPPPPPRIRPPTLELGSDGNEEEEEENPRARAAAMHAQRQALDPYDTMFEQHSQYPLEEEEDADEGIEDDSQPVDLRTVRDTGENAPHRSGSVGQAVCSASLSHSATANASKIKAFAAAEAEAVRRAQNPGGLRPVARPLDGNSEPISSEAHLGSPSRATQSVVAASAGECPSAGSVSSSVERVEATSSPVQQQPDPKLSVDGAGDLLPGEDEDAEAEIESVEISAQKKGCSDHRSEALRHGVLAAEDAKNKKGKVAGRQVSFRETLLDEAGPDLATDSASDMSELDNEDRDLKVPHQDAPGRRSGGLCEVLDVAAKKKHTLPSDLVHRPGSGSRARDDPAPGCPQTDSFGVEDVGQKSSLVQESCHALKRKKEDTSRMSKLLKERKIVEDLLKQGVLTQSQAKKKLKYLVNEFNKVSAAMGMTEEDTVVCSIASEEEDGEEEEEEEGEVEAESLRKGEKPKRLPPPIIRSFPAVAATKKKQQQQQGKKRKRPIVSDDDEEEADFYNKKRGLSKTSSTTPALSRQVSVKPGGAAADIFDMTEVKRQVRVSPTRYKISDTWTVMTEMFKFKRGSGHGTGSFPVLGFDRTPREGGAGKPFTFTFLLRFAPKVAFALGSLEKTRGGKLLSSGQIMNLICTKLESDSNNTLDLSHLSQASYPRTCFVIDATLTMQVETIEYKSMNGMGSYEGVTFIKTTGTDKDGLPKSFSVSLPTRLIPALKASIDAICEDCGLQSYKAKNNVAAGITPTDKTVIYEG